MRPALPRPSTLALGLALGLGLAGCAHQTGSGAYLSEAPAPAAGAPIPAASAAAPCKTAADCGIEVVGVRLTAADYMLDFRYKVVDTDKARQIITPQLRPHLEVERSGAKLMVPTSGKVGALRQTRSKLIEGRNYFIFFANPGHYVKAGDKVKVVMGDLSVGDLTVQ